MMRFPLRFSLRCPLPVAALVAIALSACSTTPPSVNPAIPAPPVMTGSAAAPSFPAPLPVVKPVPIKVGLVLGGGAARGFAHVGVIKVLEANGIEPDLVVGTSAGSVVGALYASGLKAADLERMALALKEDQVGDWGLPDRGVIKGEALQAFVNRSVNNLPLEKLRRLFGVVATDLNNGERLLFRTGNTGMAVRASSAVPGLFQPVNISGRDYVDGGLTSPVPVNAAREMGADFVIAVDIAAVPLYGKTQSTFDVLMQTFTIMGQSLSRHETGLADVLIRPALSRVSATDFKARKRAIAEGEKAASALVATIKIRLDALRQPRL